MKKIILTGCAALALSATAAIAQDGMQDPPVSDSQNPADTDDGTMPDSMMPDTVPPQAPVRTGTPVPQSRTNPATPTRTAPTPPPRTMPATSGPLTAPPASAQGKDYPPCKGNVQDSCINPREAGLNYGNRPLPYYPGDKGTAPKAPNGG